MPALGVNIDKNIDKKRVKSCNLMQQNDRQKHRQKQK